MGLVAHVGFEADGWPYVVPMAYARLDGDLLLHGSVASRLVRLLGAGSRVCVTVTLLDGIVLARSAFNTSMNYRSAIVIGETRAVVDPTERAAAFAALLDRIVPGRFATVRAPNDAELRQTLVARLPIDHCSAKVRTGPPDNDADDRSFPVWAGEIPLRLVRGGSGPGSRAREGDRAPRGAARLLPSRRVRPVSGDRRLRVTPTVVIPLDELEWRVDPSGGPGGQHANVTRSRVEVRFDVEASLARRTGPGPDPRAAGPRRAGHLRRRPVAGPQPGAGPRTVAGAARRRVAGRATPATHEADHERVRRRVDDKKRRGEVKRQRRFRGEPD